MANEEQNNEVQQEQENPQQENPQQKTEEETAQGEQATPETADAARQLEALAMELKRSKDAELRAYAEMDNLRKRTESEITRVKQFALSSFAKDLLEVIDNLERALGAIDHDNPEFQNVVKGVELTLKSMMKVMNHYGVEQIDPKGQPFDPNTQHAIQMVESNDVAANTVIDVMQKGYNLNGRNIRPAMVVISKGGATVDTEA